MNLLKKLINNIIMLLKLNKTKNKNIDILEENVIKQTVPEENILKENIPEKNVIEQTVPEENKNINILINKVKKIFPPISSKNIEKNLPYVINSLKKFNLYDKDMLLMAISTIRAETEGFIPISEFKSKYNTLNQAFDLYDNRKDLGNQGHPDGSRFKGRGLIQLTGRNNYQIYGDKLNINLIENPELANDIENASDILAIFIKDKELKIRTALKNKNLKLVRKLINGGSHGLDKFINTYEKGYNIITDEDLK